MKIDINIGKVEFKSPITVASGTFTYIDKYYSKKDLSHLGAITLKTVTLNKREGNPMPRIVETNSGMINAIGIENDGIDALLRDKLPKLIKLGIPLIVSISGNSDKEFVEMIKRINKHKASIVAIELNLSCPNLGHKVLVAQDSNLTKKIVMAAKKTTTLPIIAKLTPNVTDITKIAQAAELGGADAIAMVNTFSAMAINVNTRKPVLGNVVGGLSGPAILPIALACVYKTAKVINIPIIAMGGIMSTDDALQFLIAGASMIAVGTSSFVNPSASKEIYEGINDYMKKNKIKEIKSLIGSVNL